MSEYYESVKVVNKLKPFVEDLDKVANILYNNIDKDVRIWALISRLEDVRVYYFLKLADHQAVVDKKGQK
jgi:hypothetical protein